MNNLASVSTDTQWKHKSKKFGNLGRYGKQNMLRPYLKIWEWEWIFGRAVKTIASLGVRKVWKGVTMTKLTVKLYSAAHDPVRLCDLFCRPKYDYRILCNKTRIWIANISTNLCHEGMNTMFLFIHIFPMIEKPFIP